MDIKQHIAFIQGFQTADVTGKSLILEHPDTILSQTEDVITHVKLEGIQRFTENDILNTVPVLSSVYIALIFMLQGGKNDLSPN